MIHYTPLAMEEVLYNEQNNNLERTFVTEGEKTFYVDKHPTGECTIVQLLSTNPNDYLNANYQPGMTITENRL